MAARFWQAVLGSGIALAIVVAAVFERWCGLSALTTLLVGLMVLVLVPFVIVAASFAARRALTPRMERQHSSVSCVVRAWWVESLAVAWAALSMGLGPLRRRQDEHSALQSGDDAVSPVLLIHGIVCDGRVWGPFRKRLEACGFAPVRTIDLAPLFGDIDSHAGIVARELGEMQLRAGGIPVAVVTHSMGGLVARAALRSLGSNVVSRLVTIAAPHHGTVVARLFPQLPLTRMRPDSPWLQNLNAEQESHLPVPVTSIYSSEDALVAPARSAILQGARLHELRGVGHLSLLRSGEAFACVRAALEAT